jgi:hypothetical protein
MKTTRRRVITWGASGAALLAVGGVLRAVTRSYALPTGEAPPVALSVKELVVVRAIVQALHPGEGAFPAGLALGVDRSIDEEIYSQDPAMAQDLKDAIQLLEHAPPVVGVWGRLTELEPGARADAFEKLKTRGPDVVVQAAVALHQLAGLLVFGHPQTWRAMGYDGPLQPQAVPHDSHARYLVAAQSTAARVQRRGTGAAS